MPRAAPQTERLVETIDLLALRRHKGVSATEVARHLGVDRATCYPMLRTLCGYGWLVRDPGTKRYFLGPALISVGATAAATIDLVDAARGELLALADSTDAACALIRTSAGELVVADIAAPSGGSRASHGLQIADTLPLHAPLGAVLVAWDDEHARRRWRGPSRRDTAPEDEQRAEASLCAIRQRGFAVEALDHPRDVQSEVSYARERASTRRETLSRLAIIAEEFGDDLLIDNLRAHRRPMHVLSINAPVFGPGGRAAAALCLFFDPPRALAGCDAQALGERVAAHAAATTATLARVSA